jgi:CheY-like chemotaxis protein
MAMAPAPQPRPCILIVEDNADLRDSLAELLQYEGYEVARAANGQEALRYLRECPPPCLILLDLMMPVMNGWEFRKQQLLDPTLSSIPVAIVTGVRNSLDQVAALDAVDYLQKPVDMSELLKTVAAHC